MQYKLIENYHMENAILRKDFKLGTTGSFFHAFTHSLKPSPSECVTLHPFFPPNVLTKQFKQGLIRYVSFLLLVHLLMIFLLNYIIQQNKPT
jgi:hypothetical protein